MQAQETPIATTIKLNLGARDKHIPGFTSIDIGYGGMIDSFPDGNITMDASNLFGYADHSVAEIYASHIIEHFSHNDTLKVLKEWFRVLQRGGILYLAVPDIRRAVEIYMKHGMNDWIVKWLWGGQEYALAYHYTGFDFPRLKGLLLKAGFSEASQVIDLPVHGDGDCSTLVFSEDRLPVSLNVVAVK